MADDSKLDWFPLYVRDLLSSARVQMMRPEERGWYVLLLCYQWDSGPLPKDMDDMGSLLGLDGDRMATAWKRIGRAFVEVSDGYVNERLEGVRSTQQARMEQRKTAGKRGAQARWQQQDNGDRMATAMRSDCDPNSIKKESKKNKKNPPTEVKKKGALPPEWSPNDAHRAKAESLRLNLDAEAEAFRDHAAANGRTQIDWDAAFRLWLGKADQLRLPSRPHIQPAEPKRHHLTAAEVAKFYGD